MFARNGPKKSTNALGGVPISLQIAIVCIHLNQAHFLISILPKKDI